MSTAHIQQVEGAARAAVNAFASAGLRSYLVGELACWIYGGSRVPLEVDIICSTNEYTPTELDAFLAATDTNFHFVVEEAAVGGTQSTLWYRPRATHQFPRSSAFRVKVNVLVPSNQGRNPNIPCVPPQRITYRSHSDLPLIPFLPLLLCAFQAWAESTDQLAAGVKRCAAIIDVRDVDELLDLAVKRYGVDVTTHGRWLPPVFLEDTARCAQRYAQAHPHSAEKMTDVGVGLGAL